MLYRWQKMNECNLEQQIDKSASEPLALLKIAHGEHTMKKQSFFFERQRGLKEGQGDMYKDTRNEQPKVQRTDANVISVQNLVHTN